MEGSGAGGEGNSPNPASDENGDTFLWRRSATAWGCNGDAISSCHDGAVNVYSTHLAIRKKKGLYR
ncbi:MAG: hypothetical protein V4629_02320 [Pseudomonadota bacterium]